MMSAIESFLEHVRNERLKACKAVEDRGRDGRATVFEMIKGTAFVHIYNPAVTEAQRAGVHMEFKAVQKTRTKFLNLAYRYLAPYAVPLSEPVQRRPSIELPDLDVDDAGLELLQAIRDLEELAPLYSAAPLVEGNSAKPVVMLGEHPQIVIPGQPAVALKFEQAEYLHALIECGDWMSSSEFRKDSRPDRICSELPKLVLDHIQTDKRKGKRWL